MQTTIFTNEFNKIIISCILGLSLAAIFKKVCVDDNCLIIKSPNEINGQIFSEGDKCYKYNSQKTQCNK